MKNIGLQKATKLEYYFTHKEIHDARRDAWRKNNPERVKAQRHTAHYLHQYGITPEEAEKMLTAQNNKCAICNKLIIFDNQIGAHVDHDHDTDMIRGILCNNCNLGLGHFKDDITILFNTINYLRDFKKKRLALIAPQSKELVPTKHEFINPFTKQPLFNAQTL